MIRVGMRFSLDGRGEVGDVRVSELLTDFGLRLVTLRKDGPIQRFEE